MDNYSIAQSLLTEPERHPLLPSATVAALGTVVVVAPHPDDESLGCGGLLALLAGAGSAAYVVVMTDGSRSHPNSLSHPSARLAALRERETLDALAILGIPAEAAIFLRYRDCGLPAAGTPACREAAAAIREILVSLAPQTVLVPWRRDPHCDHEATWHVLREAVGGLRKRPRWLEYPVWAWTQTEDATAPRTDATEVWRLDISDVLGLKQGAIAEHRSQLGKVVLDDPDGFVLTAATLENFTRPWELFIELKDG